MSESELLEQSLELCAERAGDIAPAVFERFFEIDAGAGEQMRHSDDGMRGRMFESVLELFLNEDHFGPGNYLDWELDNHRAYDTTQAMYRSLFEALRGVVAQSLGEHWPTFEPSWNARIERIMRQVDNHPLATAAGVRSN